MKYMAPWLQGQKFKVMLKQLKLHLGQGQHQICVPEFGRVAVEITEKGQAKEKRASAGIFSNHTTRKTGVSYITVSKFVRIGRPVEWDVENLCEPMHLIEKDGKICLCQIKFRVLCGDQSLKSKSKMVVIGKVSLNIAGLAKETTDFQSDVEKKLPIEMVIGGEPIEAVLLVRFNFTKSRDVHDFLGIFENTGESKKEPGFFGRVKSYTKYKKPKKRNINQQEGTGSSFDSDYSSAFDSEGSNETSSSSSSTELANSADTNSFRGKENRWDSVHRKLSLLAMRRKLTKLKSFGGTRKKQGPPTPDFESAVKEDGIKDSALNEREDGDCEASDSGWQVKELISRDGQAKLKTEVFFASFDQRSEKASGESACTALVALVAHWLHENKGMPTRSEFDTLITEGSHEWRKLCNNDFYSNLFPDKHFDLETVVEANLRPVRILPDMSFIGFFSPEKFGCLKGAMSFDEIWAEINCNIVAWEPKVYIVSWNDHFFVLKIEADACYIIDSLGERLLEGCREAYILKFDNSSFMYAKAPGRSENPQENKSESTRNNRDDESLPIISRGKECCREFIKRFLAAIQVQQVVEEEKNGTLSNSCIHRQLQIDFHYSSSHCT